MRLKTYAAANLSISLLIIVMVSAALSTTTSYLAQSVFHIGQTTESIYVVQRLEVMLLANFRDVMRAQREERDKAGIAKMQGQLELESRDLIKQLDAFVSDTAEEALVKETGRAVTDYQVAVNELAESGLNPETIYTVLTPRIDKLQVLMDRLAHVNLLQARDLKSWSMQESKQANYFSAGVIAMILVLVPISALYARWGIYLPLRHVSARLKAFANDASDDPAAIHSPKQGVGELREIAEAFNVMASRLKSQKKTQLQHLASVAHDLRNPLSAITMSTELLAEADDLPAERRELAVLLRRQATHLERIVGDLLDMARVEAGQLDMQLSPVDLRPMVKEAVMLFKTVSTTHHFELDLPDRPVVCQCDATRLNQVMVNLISNAIKYSPNKGDIVVKLEQVGDHAVISVTDQGMGISEQDRLALFEPFRRGAAAATSIPGAGLGLAAARKIVEAHRGKIAVASLPGRGSTFSVTLPQSVNG